MRKRKSVGENKKVLNAKKKTFNGIEFRSSLELFTYKKLKEAGIKTKYEKHTFVIQEGFKTTNEVYTKRKEGNSFTFAKKRNTILPITYTPDFVYLDGKKGFIIEVKGFATETFNIKWKMFLSFLEQNGYEVDLYIPRNQKNVEDMIEIIKNKNV